VPGLMLLVPGSIGFGSLARFIEKDVVSAVETAFSMMLVAVAFVIFRSKDLKRFEYYRKTHLNLFFFDHCKVFCLYLHFLDDVRIRLSLLIGTD